MPQAKQPEPPAARFCLQDRGPGHCHCHTKPVRSTPGRDATRLLPTILFIKKGPAALQPQCHTQPCTGAVRPGCGRSRRRPAAEVWGRVWHRSLEIHRTWQAHVMGMAVSHPTRLCFKQSRQSWSRGPGVYGQGTTGTGPLQLARFCHPAWQPAGPGPGPWLPDR